jgi:hypothetical protein
MPFVGKNIYWCVCKNIYCIYIYMCVCVCVCVCVLYKYKIDHKCLLQCTIYISAHKLF